MAAPRSFLLSVCGLSLLFCVSSGSRRTSQDRCGYRVQSAAEGARKLAVTLRADNCSSSYQLGKHVIHEASDVSFSHLACDDQAAVVVHWSASPLGIEHIKGFRVYLEDKNPDGKQCQHLLLKDPRQLNYSHRSSRLTSQPFGGLTFDTDYMVRVVPFPSLMNESFFPPSFLRTNSCEVLLGPDNLVCKPFWKPKSLNVSQLGSNLHVTFDVAPPTFGLQLYYLYYRLRQDGLLRVQRCRPDLNQARTTCVLQDVSQGTYVVELRDSSNTTRRQIQYHVSQVHSPWAGPIRAMAITVPLVIMSAFATLFTVVCRKKQQENIYSQLDEESSESSNQSAALSSERPRPRPKVFICYSNRDGSKHTGVIQSFAYFLQDFCGCEVVLDLWEHLEMCKEGQMSWLSRQLDEADLIITVCSKGLRYHMEKKSRRGKTPVGRRGNSGGGGSPAGGSNGDLFVVAVAMIAEKLRLAKQSEEEEEEGGEHELSRFLAVYFDYSTESDVPTALSLAPRLKLMDQLPQLYARLHAGQLAPADPEQQPANVSRRNYFRSKSGRSLYVSICNMHQHISQNPDWFEKQLVPAGRPSDSAPKQAPPPAVAVAATPGLPPEPSCSSAAAPRPERRVVDSGLVLNEVLVRTPSLDGATRRNLLLLAPGSGPERQHGSVPGSTSRLSCGVSPKESLSSSSSSAPCVLQEEPRPAPAHTEEGGSGGPEAPPPRDSGIYDSSVPSSELSIPLMEGLSHDQADSSSLADSESSSSGLGDEEPPTVASLHSIMACKAQLHHHRHLEHGGAHAASL